jgi:hypothetical protein
MWSLLINHGAKQESEEEGKWKTKRRKKKDPEVLLLFYL